MSPSLPPKKLGPYVPHGLIKLVQKKKPDSATLKKREESKRQQVYLSIKKIADTIISNQNQPSQMDAESGSGEDTEEEDIFKEPSRIQNSRKKKLETATKDCLKNSNGSSEDVFGGSDDDSFLISASQAIEKLPEQESPARKMSKARQNTANSSSYSNMRSESKKKTPCAKKKLEIVSDPFDDGDDSFDLLMSQIDEKVINKAKPSSSATKLVKAPTPKFSNRNTTHSVNSKSSGEFKRFHSADDNKDNSRYVPRSNSSPDVPVIRQGLPGGRQTGSSSSSQIKPKCSQADIERKRLEALKRRRNHSGKGKL